MKRSIALWGCLIALGVSSCSSSEQASGDSEVPEKSLSELQKAHLASFEVKWPKRTNNEVTDRIGNLTRIMLGRDQKTEDIADFVTTGMRKLEAKQALRGRPLKDAPAIHVRYHAHVDELKLTDEDTWKDRDGADIGEAQARTKFRGVFEELVSSGIVRRGDFNPDKVETSYTGMAEGRTGEPGTERVLEYQYTLLRQINGIDFANSGIVVSIHKSGRVSGIRLGGAEITSRNDSGVEVPIGKGRSMVPRVSALRARQRFDREHPAVGPVRGRVMYAVPEENGTLAVPRYVVSYNGTSKVGGQTVTARGVTLGYSLEAEDESPVTYTPMPAPKTQSQPQRQRTR